jgi:hypothetical protein
MWADLVPAIVQTLLLLIPAIGTLLIGLITRATLKMQAARQAATAVEFSPLAQRGLLSSEQKLAMAVDQVQSGTSPLTKMSEAEAVRIVELALPAVARLSDPSKLKPTSLRPSDVKTIKTPPVRR